jgi:membrane protein DedA with SNARE-associated domain
MSTPPPAVDRRRDQRRGCLLVPGVIESMDMCSYIVLFVGVAASWIGIPVVGGAALTTAGVLGGDGQLNVWLVIAVATAAAWTGGYAGYLLGDRAREALSTRPGRWHRQRRRALGAGERLFRRWGPLGVFLTPAWVSGALRMPRKSFLIWNGLAAIVSSLVSVFGAYALASALLGQLSPRSVIALVVAVTAATSAGFAMYRRCARSHAIERRAG